MPLLFRLILFVFFVFTLLISVPKVYAAPNSNQILVPVQLIVPDDPADPNNPDPPYSYKYEQSMAFDLVITQEGQTNPPITLNLFYNAGPVFNLSCNYDPCVNVLVPDASSGSQNLLLDSRFKYTVFVTNMHHYQNGSIDESGSISLVPGSQNPQTIQVGSSASQIEFRWTPPVTTIPSPELTITDHNLNKGENSNVYIRNLSSEGSYIISQYGLDGDRRQLNFRLKTDGSGCDYFNIPANFDEIENPVCDPVRKELYYTLSWDQFDRSATAANYETHVNVFEFSCTNGSFYVPQCPLAHSLEDTIRVEPETAPATSAIMTLAPEEICSGYTSRPIAVNVTDLPNDASKRYRFNTQTNTGDYQPPIENLVPTGNRLSFTVQTGYNGYSHIPLFTSTTQVSNPFNLYDQADGSLVATKDLVINPASSNPVDQCYSESQQSSCDTTDINQLPTCSSLGNEYTISPDPPIACTDPKTGARGYQCTNINGKLCTEGNDIKCVSTNTLVDCTTDPTKCSSSGPKICPFGDEDKNKNGEEDTDENWTGILTAIGCIPTEPQALIQASLRVVTLVAGGIALLLMAFGAIGMITSLGNPEKLKNAQGQFTSAVIGLLFIIFAVLLMKVIGVDILGIPGFAAS